jgi:hypothetical protein
MGFGFNLVFIFFLIPVTGILLIVWLISRQQIVGKLIGLMWLGVIAIVMLSFIVQWLTSKTKLTKSDYYGEYIVNLEYFKGAQTNWQYNHFRFEITEQDSIFFYTTEQEKILKTYRGTIKTSDPKNHRSERLILDMEKPLHHIMSENPTTYRSAWDFYLVFYSPKYDNIFFKKGKWKPIE